MLMSGFNEKVSEWKKILIEKKNPEEADKYYVESLFRDVADIARSKSIDLIERFNSPVHLVLTVGKRWKPLALTISILNPDKVYWIVTNKTFDVARKTKSICEKIFDFNFNDEIKSVAGYDLTEIYAYIWGILKDGNYGSLVINATGGTKPMTCGAMTVGFIARYLGYENCFIVYLHGLEKSENGITYVEPGSEKLILVENPFQSFGNFIIMKAKDIAGGYGFEIASNELNRLLKTIEWIQMRELARFYMEIFNAYMKWEFERELKQAKQYLSRAMKITRYVDVRDKIDKEEVKILNNNLAFIEKLIYIVDKLNSREKLSVLSNPDMIILLIANLYVSGVRRIRMNKFDEAALIFYRIMELCFQSLLAKYDIDTSNATEKTYSKVAIKAGFKNLREFKDSYIKVVDEVSRLVNEKFLVELPSKISLITGLLILKALNDEFVHRIDFKELFRTINIRNLCWLEHGFQKVNSSGAKRLRKTTLKIIEAYINSWNKKDLDRKFKEAIKMSRYISEKAISL